VGVTGFPSGLGWLPDGRLLLVSIIVAETFGHRLTAFDIHPDGTLSQEGSGPIWKGPFRTASASMARAPSG